MKSIVFTGGGTAGHVTPILAVYPHLINHFDKFYFFGSKNGIEKRMCPSSVEYMSITTAKLERSSIFKNTFLPYNFTKGYYEAKKFLKDIKPSVVFSKGGYVALPTVFAAFSLKIPVIVHECDYSLGLANKLSKRKARLVLTSFEDTAKSLSNGKCVAPPIRESVFKLNKDKALEKLGLKNNKPILLVLGGSKGSKTLNNEVIASLNRLLEKYEVLHICGDAHTNNIKKQGYKQIGFLDDISEAYSVCDLCLSRCGANTAFELLALKIPTLFIPLANSASRGDQIENANYFLKNGVCNVLQEQNLNSNMLISALDKTFKNRKTYQKNIESLKLLGGAEEIAKILKKF